jgi:hypothetical protein
VKKCFHVKRKNILENQRQNIEIPCESCLEEDSWDPLEVGESMNINSKAVPLGNI